MRTRGDGRLLKRGRTWWVQFYVDGRQVRESSKSTDPTKAEKYLRGRLKEVHAHELDASRTFVTRRDKRRTIAELMDALKTDFQIRGKASAQNLSNITRVCAHFGAVHATALSSEDVDRHIAQQLKDGYANATINRHLQLLGQSFELAKLPAPDIRRLDERGNVRRGFFSGAEIRRVLANLPAELADFVLFSWCTGMRKGEVASLAWEDVDGDVIRLRAESSKNREARLIPLVGELGELIERRRNARQVTVDGMPMLTSLIFHRAVTKRIREGVRKKRAGEPVGDIRKVWAAACKKAGVPRLFHDLRRSACRNMLGAGVPQTIAMKISGHKTDSMFKRYAVSDEADLRTALERTQQYLKTVKEKVIAMPAKTSERGQIGDNGTQVVARRVGK